MKSEINADRTHDENAGGNVDIQQRYKHAAESDETVIYDEKSDDAWIESDISLDVADCR